MAGIKEQLEKIDNLSVRERGILLGGGLVLILMLWFSVLHEPLAKEKQQLRTQIDKKQTEIETLGLQFQILNESKQKDPNLENRQRKDQLITELEQTRNEILESTQNLIAPKMMPEILRSMLAKTEGLKLVKLNGLGKTPIIDKEKDPDDAGSKTDDSDKDDEYDSAYKHGMKIVFEGNFLTTLDYIKKLESLEWKFFWDSIEFKVETYPRSTSSITLYTLSLDENWIGI